jgi:nicotinate-nucleotide--dimethylbenzimidazole phosphoribosyltransferase
MASPGTHTGRYAAGQLAAVYRLIGERQDLRAGFRPDPVPGVVLARLLAAAHHVPVPGSTQPWDFVVITGRERRERIAGLARRRQMEYAAGRHAAPGQAGNGHAGEAEFAADPVREAPLSIVVTCDQTRGGEHAVGRPGPPPPAACRCALAVAGLWLAARPRGSASAGSRSPAGLSWPPGCGCPAMSR